MRKRVYRPRYSKLCLSDRALFVNRKINNSCAYCDQGLPLVGFNHNIHLLPNDGTPFDRKTVKCLLTK
jgi:hypothetical protein